MNNKEIKQLTTIFMKRLVEQIDNSSCNDITKEFPKSIRDKFKHKTDYDVFVVWKRYITKKIKDCPAGA